MRAKIEGAQEIAQKDQGSEGVMHQLSVAGTCTFLQRCFRHRSQYQNDLDVLLLSRCIDWQLGQGRKSDKRFIQVADW